jgi:hypothetical protein
MSTSATAADPRYPIGKWQFTPNMSAQHRAALIQQIAELPAQFRAALKGLTEQQLDTPYREDGWTLRQVAHHVPDSHLNAYVRFKWAVTENGPAIKAYNEKAWAETPEVKATPVSVSLDILESLHQRWVILLNSLKDEDWQRKIEHPENGTMTLEMMLAIYAWHGRHHTAHVLELRKQKGW